MNRISIISLVLCLTFFLGCNFHIEKVEELPGMPLIYLDFENEIENKGITKISFSGKENVSFSQGLSGNVLDLSVNANFRKPIVINNQEGISWDGYPGITIMFYVKIPEDDFNDYIIASQLDKGDDFGETGWKIGRSVCGTWYWEISDGTKSYKYKPTKSRQPLNDGEWHHLAFSLNFSNDEARLYYDGNNVAIYSLEKFNFNGLGGALMLGGEILSAFPIYEVLNGYIDDFYVWSRTLTSSQVKALYSTKIDSKMKMKYPKIDSLTVMTWNIWDNGQRTGKFTGLQRIAEIIKESGADIVSLQEAESSAPIIADMLNYNLYQRGNGVTVISRYPLEKTYNLHLSNISGAVTVQIDKEQNVIIVPVSLSYHPNQEPYILSNQAQVDTIIGRELKTRGSEIRYVVWELQSLLKNKNNVPIVVAGEFNAGSHLDWTERNKENRYNLVVNYPTSVIMEEAGFVDTYRMMHPNEIATPGYTWSPVFNKVLQNRIDYIFYNSEIIEPLNSWLIDSHDIMFPSDHAAVVTSFKFVKQKKRLR